MKKSDVNALNEAVEMGERKAEMAMAELERIKTESASREKMIAQCYEVIGQVKGVQMVVEFGTVASLVWLKDAKEQKIYRDIPGIETWENFCKSIGKDRRTLDEDIQNLATFGEQFLATVASLRVGYRELRKLRQLTHDGAVVIESGAVVIGGEIIPIDSDHSEDLQAAIEKIIDDKARVQEELDATVKAKDRVLEAKEGVIKKQEKELSKLSREAKRLGLTPDEDAYIKRMAATRDAIDGLLTDIDPERNVVPSDASPRMIAAYLETVQYLHRVMGSTFENAVGMYGTPDESAEAGGWTPPIVRDKKRPVPASGECRECRSLAPPECAAKCCNTCHPPCTANRVTCFLEQGMQ